MNSSIYHNIIGMHVFGIHLNPYAAMDGGEMRGWHVQGWTFTPQLR